MAGHEGWPGHRGWWGIALDAPLRRGRRVVFRPELMALSTFASGRLWGARYGTARPWVLALHGWGRDHHDFDDVLSGFDAVALDLPGHGVAPEPPEAWSTRQYAEWVAPVLHDLGGGPGSCSVTASAPEWPFTWRRTQRGRRCTAHRLPLSCSAGHPSPQRRERVAVGRHLRTRPGAPSIGPGSSLTTVSNSCDAGTGLTSTGGPALL